MWRPGTMIWTSTPRLEAAMSASRTCLSGRKYAFWMKMLLRALSIATK